LICFIGPNPTCLLAKVGPNAVKRNSCPFKSLRVSGWGPSEVTRFALWLVSRTAILFKTSVFSAMFLPVSWELAFRLGVDPVPCTALHKCLPNGRPEANIDTFGGRTTLKRACSRIERSRLAKRLGFCFSPLAPHPFPPHPYPHFAASRCRFYCRFYCRFWMPLLVVVWQSKITARYNIVEEGTAGVEQILENSAFSAHSSSRSDRTKRSYF